MMEGKESSITVSVRVRPFTPQEANNLLQVDDSVFLGDGSLKPMEKFRPLGIRNVINMVDDNMLIFDPPETNPLNKMYQTVFPSSSRNSRIREHRFVFDKLFDMDASQQEVFENTTKPLLDNILDGFNATVFAYGATGCGKTHTISGNPDNPGVIFLTMKELYSKINALHDKVFEVSLSFLEIYNETIKDLLNPDTNNKKLIIREDANKKISVSNLSVHSPSNVEEVMDLIMIGNQNRTSSPTEANATSSRSHAVLQINVSKRNKSVDLTEEHTFATLSIIDLAGSERAAATKNRGKRLNEGANINKSLLALGNCINALCDPKKRNHIPYRDSKLTRLLKFSLGGNCKTCMIVCISPSSSHYDETLNTLKYANRAKEIKTKLIRNQHNLDRHVGSYLKMITQQKQEIEELKHQQELLINSKIESINLNHGKTMNLILEHYQILKRKITKNQDKWQKILILAKRKILIMQKNDFNKLLKFLTKDNVMMINLIEQVLSKVTLQIKDLENQYNIPNDIDLIINDGNINVLNKLKLQEHWNEYHTIMFENLINNLKELVEKDILFNSSILFDYLLLELGDYNYTTNGFIKLFNNVNNKENASSELVQTLESLINGEFDQFLESKCSIFFQARLKELNENNLPPLNINEDLKRSNTSPLRVSPPRSIKKSTKFKPVSPNRLRSKKVHFEHSIDSDMSVDESMLKSDFDDDSPLQNTILDNIDDLDLKFDPKLSPQINKLMDFKQRKPKRITSLKKFDDKLLLNKASATKIPGIEMKQLPKFNSVRPPTEMLNFHGDGSRGIDSSASERVD